MTQSGNKRTIYVYADWEGLNDPTLMGVLYSERLRGKEIFSFEYTDDWLQNHQAFMLDPDLQLYSGIQYLNDESKNNFGMFLDSSPDRWGRILMRRREAAIARNLERKEENLFETDYLLGVYDGHRMGGLRFKLDEDGAFLSDNKDLSSPPWTSIRELEEISLKLEGENIIHDPNYLKWLEMLVIPGSSLGGARPKASVMNTDNQLWIAKFPSKQDTFDIGAWEKVVHELACECGIEMAPAKAKRFSGKHHTFLTKRFDRTAEGKRVHFASAMTLLGYTDGNDAHDGVSYLELVEFITTYGSNTNQDLDQLWRRIVFSICVSNTDDHLRNHGFLLTNNGWTLSPAYDINPNETGAGLKLNISEHDNSLDLSLALEVAPYFRIEEEKAAKIIQEIKTQVNKWSDIASKYGISASEKELKSNAFKNCEKD